MAPRNAGTLRELLRYPVKSMTGEALTGARVLAEHGVQGDRAFAFLDVETGRVASAKDPRRWSAVLGCEARFVEPLASGQRHGPVVITLPGRATLRSDDADADRGPAFLPHLGHWPSRLDVLTTEVVSPVGMAR